ncbi:SCP-like protein [Teladorsagia circumcincta]|uniref:SCP-like protein n=1 Tax=Teladorsagia circumcincta TaxID=45464 RepID=A0A2G9UDT7_TELCI|nr:SCP-like protein [Teladorsagia circumcincta]
MEAETSAMSTEAMSLSTEEMAMTTEEMSMTTEATAMTTETTSTVASTTPFFDPISEEIRTNITNMHNYRRSRLAQGMVPNGATGKKLPAGANINELSYSTDLEHDAQAYANTCPSSGSSETSRNGQGENFATISSSEAHSYQVAIFRVRFSVTFVFSVIHFVCTYSDVQAIQSFWRVIHYNNINEKMMFTDALSQRTDMLQFTQMAWASTTHVGCGVKLCNGNYVVVCRYNPGGNTVNEKIYNVGPKCSQCVSCTTSYLYQGLCTEDYIYVPTN